MSQSRVQDPQNGALTGIKTTHRQSLTLGGWRAEKSLSSTMRTRSTIGAALLTLAVLVATAEATTLLRLSMDDMIRQSTSIVRAKVTATSSSFRGRDIYTHYQFQVLETLKAAPLGSGGGAVTDVAVPGGVASGLREMVPGAPTLAVGQEYVIFLWTSRSGLTQVIGLSQGLFNVLQDQGGNAVLVRPSAPGLMLDRAGNVVDNSAVAMTLSDLRAQVQKALGTAK